MITYSSTRGGDQDRSFDHVLLEGLARDGGLFIPNEFPTFSKTEIESFKTKPYQDIAHAIMFKFLDGWISANDLTKLIDKAYSNFTHDEITPLKKLDDDLYCLELFHGPTLAFKDVALQLLGLLFEHSLSKKEVGKRTVLGATSGDTGSAAIQGCRGLDYLNIVILHPHGRTSEIQRKQMTTVLDENVLNIGVKGSFDDCQNMVKLAFGDEDFRDQFGLTAVNSINWARILSQIPYYFYASLRAKQAGKPLKVMVPTGNFGNILAGYYAKKMGAPIDQLIAVTNENDSLFRFFQTGEMKTGVVTQTPSPSMDIQISSNFERFLYELLGHDSGLVSQSMSALKTKGSYSVDQDKKAKFTSIMKAYRCSNDDTERTIKDIYERYDYMLDPHSATGVYGVFKDKEIHEADDCTYISLCCAHPAKFPDVIQKTLDQVPDKPDFIADLESKQERVEILEADVSLLKETISSKFAGK